jgi:hypothetical protein
VNRSFALAISCIFKLSSDLNGRWLDESLPESLKTLEFDPLLSIEEWPQPFAIIL